MGLEMNKLFFCIPIKVGLLVYGYLNLIFIIHGLDNQYYNDSTGLTEDMVIFFLCLTEIIFTIIFIIGMHENQPKSLKIFFWYKTTISSVVFLGLAIIEVCKAVAFRQQQLGSMGDDIYYPDRHSLLFTVSCLGVLTALTIYLLVAVRRYYRKLELEVAEGTEKLYKSTNNLLLAGKKLRDEFEEFTNETIKAKSIVA